MIRFVCILIGYIFGLFQTSYIYGKMHGIDIRSHGSGNAGTTNILRTLGTRAGVITFFGDALKCVFAVLLVRLLFGKSYADMSSLLAIYTAAGVILGHNFPFYLGFHGGKGIAATGGLIFAINLPMTVLAIITFAAVFCLTHYVSLGSLVIYVCFVAELIVFGQNGAFGMTQQYLNEMYVVGVVLVVLAFWMHRANIGRLIRGEERKTYLFQKNKSADDTGKSSDKSIKSSKK